MTRNDAVVGVAAGQGDAVFAAMKHGEVLKLDMAQASIAQHMVVPGVLALACHGNGSLVCVGSKGVVAVWHKGSLHQDVVDDAVLLSSVSYDDDEGICAVGQYDDRTGVVVRRAPGESEWRQIRLTPTPPGLLALSASAAGYHVVCGRRGYVAVWDHQGWSQVDTGTDHPLRAVLINAAGGWLAGGGGWVAEMPILLQGEGSAARSIINAPANRVIVGMVQDSAGVVWIAENRSNGQEWAGVLLRYDGRAVELSGDRFQERLFGIACSRDRLVVCGSDGLLAWANVP